MWHLFKIGCGNAQLRCSADCSTSADCFCLDDGGYHISGMLGMVPLAFGIHILPDQGICEGQGLEHQATGIGRDGHVHGAKVCLNYPSMVFRWEVQT